MPASLPSLGRVVSSIAHASGLPFSCSSNKLSYSLRTACTPPLPSPQMGWISHSSPTWVYWTVRRRLTPSHRQPLVCPAEPRIFSPISRKLSYNSRTSLVRALLGVYCIQPPHKRFRSAPARPSCPRAAKRASHIIRPTPFALSLGERRPLCRNRPIVCHPVNPQIPQILTQTTAPHELHPAPLLSSFPSPFPRTSCERGDEKPRTRN